MKAAQQSQQLRTCLQTQTPCLKLSPTGIYDQLCHLMPVEEQKQDVPVFILLRPSTLVLSKTRLEWRLWKARLLCPLCACPRRVCQGHLNAPLTHPLGGRAFILQASQKILFLSKFLKNQLLDLGISLRKAVLISNRGQDILRKFSFL